MDNQQQQVAERIKQANNILITVSSSPSVDQLAACIGLTLAVNKLGKHATAVFSGEVPSTLEFLQPDKTIEKNTDSLRDFIISLDKAKADKLRYKVEDKVVKIFITPYRTSISDRDLDFSQGDFNVDVVIALGVHQQSDLDHAITIHGRILHDATVATINVLPGGELGSMNWLDAGASSLSEMAVLLVETLDKNLLDPQISTALLTGIVAETERFSNAKTTPQTMSISAELMATGANQQLVATKLEEPVRLPAPAPIAHTDATDHEPVEEAVKKDQVADDGTLEISHDASSAGVSDDEQPSAVEATPKEEQGASAQESKPAPTDEPTPAHQKQADVHSKATHDPDSDQPYLKDKPELRLEPLASESDASPQPPEAHEAEQKKEQPEDEQNPQKEKHQVEPPQIDIDESGALHLPPKEEVLPEISHHTEAPKMITPPPVSSGAQLTANTEPEQLTPSIDPLTLPPVDGQLLSREGFAPPQEPALSTILPPSEGVTPNPASARGGQASSVAPSLDDLPLPSLTPPPEPSPVSSVPLPSVAAPAGPALSTPTTLSELEQQLNSSHLQDAAPAPEKPPVPNDATPVLNVDSGDDTEQIDLEKARSAVEDAISASGIETLPPIHALNAQPLPLNTEQGAGVPTVVPAPSAAPAQPSPGQPFTPPSFGMPLASPQDTAVNPHAPPPVPPPMMPPLPPYPQQ